MTLYAVTYEETLSRTVLIEADSELEALDKMDDAVNEERIVLGSEDYMGNGDIFAREADEFDTEYYTKL